MALTLFENTYLEDASAYLVDDSTWSEAAYEEQERALINATRFLDQLLWAGSALDANQPLAWPRVSFTYFDPVLNLYVEVAENEVPIRLEKAVARLALHVLSYPELLKGYESSYDSITVGPISITNANAASDPGKIPKIPLEVYSLLDPLLRVSASTTVWWRAN
jgi:hypothetical protein